MANGMVYVGSYDKNVYAQNAKTGAKLWSYTTGGVVYSSPAVANGVVYVGSYDKNVYALDAKSGTKLWSYTTGGGVYTSPPPASAGLSLKIAQENNSALAANHLRSTGPPLVPGSDTTEPSIRVGLRRSPNRAGCSRGFGLVHFGKAQASKARIPWLIHCVG